jgi:hypothetical protein
MISFKKIEKNFGPTLWEKNYASALHPKVGFRRKPAKYIMLIPYCVRIAVKTAHVDDHLPSTICQVTPHGAT